MFRPETIRKTYEYIIKNPPKPKTLKKIAIIGAVVFIGSAGLNKLNERYYQVYKAELECEPLLRSIKHVQNSKD